MRTILIILISLGFYSCNTLERSFNSGINWYSNTYLNDSTLFSSNAILSNDVEIMKKLEKTDYDKHIIQASKKALYCINSIDTIGGTIMKGNAIIPSFIDINKKNSTLNYYINKELKYSYHYILFKNGNQYILLIRR